MIQRVDFVHVGLHQPAMAFSFPLVLLQFDGKGGKGIQDNNRNGKYSFVKLQLKEIGKIDQAHHYPCSIISTHQVSRLCSERSWNILYIRCRIMDNEDEWGEEQTNGIRVYYIKLLWFIYTLDSDKLHGKKASERNRNMTTVQITGVKQKRAACNNGR